VRQIYKWEADCQRHATKSRLQQGVAFESLLVLEQDERRDLSREAPKSTSLRVLGGSLAKYSLAKVVSKGTRGNAVASLHTDPM
jgi:hypothetical protein